MTKLLAHRGASMERPENTMSAFRRAIEVGADGIELDVHLLCDGTLVVHHDAQLGRCASVKGDIYNFTKDNIKTFSVGEWFGKEYKSEVVPYFEEILELIKETELFLNVEIKPDNPFINNIVDVLVKLLDKYNMVNRCIISSFHHYILRDLKAKYPQYKVGILYVSPYHYDVVEYCVKNRFDAIHPYFGAVNKELVDRCHHKGLQVNVWTVDKTEDLDRMKEYGVDMIISNDVTFNFKAQ